MKPTNPFKIPTTPEQHAEKAAKLWYESYNFKTSDLEINPFLNENLKSFSELKIGWLKKARSALFYSTEKMATKLGITKAAYNYFETGELNGTITLATLQKAAEAMDCELVYAIRPKNKKTFSHGIWKKLLTAAQKHPSLKSYDPKFRFKSIAAVAKKLVQDPNFKKENSWSQRCNQKL